MNDVQIVQKWTDQQNIYLDWLASPKCLREPKTQIELSEKLGIHRNTLHNWQDIDGFKEERLKRTFDYFVTDTTDIVAALRDKALTGDTRAIDIWLERVEQIASQLELRGEFTVKEFYDSVIDPAFKKRQSDRGRGASESAELPHASAPSESSGESSEVPSPGGGEEVREELAGSVSSRQDPDSSGD